MSDTPAIVTQEVRIVDADGQPRAVLSATDGVPALRLLREDGQVGASVALDAAGRPAVMLANPNPAWPAASLQVDGKGVHVKLDRPGGASCYLFLNNGGGSGVVLIDASGRRRLNAVVDADGSSRIDRFGDDDQPLS